VLRGAGPPGYDSADQFKCPDWLRAGPVTHYSSQVSATCRVHRFTDGSEVDRA
jgi:hypothetical protein